MCEVLQAATSTSSELLIRCDHRDELLSLLGLQSCQQPDLCASPPTARGPGGPQDSPLQGEDLQEGEALWDLPAGHHPGGLHLQR